MPPSDNELIYENDEQETFQIRTKPCWICGQHSYVHVPLEAWARHDLHGIPIEAAWPEGSHEDKQLLRTGVHTKCWDEEFPTGKEII